MSYVVGLMSYVVGLMSYVIGPDYSAIQMTNDK
jgi:hypothetical protein